MIRVFLIQDPTLVSLISSEMFQRATKMLQLLFFFHRQLNFSPSDVSSVSDADNAGMDYHDLEKKTAT